MYACVSNPSFHQAANTGVAPMKVEEEGWLYPGIPLDVEVRIYIYILYSTSEQVYCRLTPLQKTDGTGAYFALYKYECLDVMFRMVLLVYS